METLKEILRDLWTNRELVGAWIPPILGSAVFWVYVLF